MENESVYKNLVQLLKMFNDRPYHLAKYLMDNSALQKEFLQRISENYKLKKISEKGDKHQAPYFTDITQMVDFYSSFSDDMKRLTDGKSTDEIMSELNQRLNDYVNDEKYEDAA
ncbi:MAG: hypothetical protein EBU33_06055, partial [Sphingobacteriia bacterium]|nr:hypothetical protein [Sphingobacteriia bacterium]